MSPTSGPSSMVEVLWAAVLITYAYLVLGALLFWILDICTLPTVQQTPLERCTAFCDSSYGELVLIEGPDPLVCSCVIGEMEVDVE